jgi:hypothetical protein
MMYADYLMLSYRGSDPVTVTSLNLNRRGANCIRPGDLRKLPVTLKLGDEVFFVIQFNAIEAADLSHAGGLPAPAEAREDRLL